MVVLKKIKASSLMETLIATVLIMVIFVIASLILNNLFSGTIKNNPRGVTAALNEIQYLYLNDKITLPYADDYEDWKITLTANKNSSFLTIEATNGKTKKVIEKELYKK